MPCQSESQILWKKPAPQFYCCPWHDIVRNLFGISGQLSQLCPFWISSALPRRGDRGFDALSAIARCRCVSNTGFGQQRKTQHHSSCCEEKLLCPSQTQYSICPLFCIVCVMLRWNLGVLFLICPVTCIFWVWWISGILMGKQGGIIQ